MHRFAFFNLNLLYCYCSVNHDEKIHIVSLDRPDKGDKLEEEEEEEYEKEEEEDKTTTMPFLMKTDNGDAAGAGDDTDLQTTKIT